MVLAAVPVPARPRAQVPKPAAAPALARATACVLGLGIESEKKLSYLAAEMRPPGLRGRRHLTSRLVEGCRQQHVVSALEMSVSAVTFAVLRADVILRMTSEKALVIAELAVAKEGVAAAAVSIPEAPHLAEQVGWKRAAVQATQVHQAQRQQWMPSLPHEMPPLLPCAQLVPLLLLPSLLRVGGRLPVAPRPTERAWPVFAPRMQPDKSPDSRPYLCSLPHRHAGQNGCSCPRALRQTSASTSLMKIHVAAPETL